MENIQKDRKIKSYTKIRDFSITLYYWKNAFKMLKYNVGYLKEYSLFIYNINLE